MDLHTKPPIELIFETLRDKSGMKQDVAAETAKAFDIFRGEAETISKHLAERIHDIDGRLKVEYHDNGAYLYRMRFAGDTLIFYRHTNVFEFDKSHSIWKTAYAQKDETLTYCGIINVFNFLTDSLVFNRMNDRGYLVARIFINREGHYFVEGKRQLGFLYNDISTQRFDAVAAKSIIESAMLYSLDFDLYTPPYEALKEIGVVDIFGEMNSSGMATAKRLGFKFSAEEAINVKGEK